MYKPGLRAEEAIESTVETMLTVLPEQLGIPEIIAGCIVIDLDPRGVGDVLPRYVEIRIQNYKQLALWRGMPLIEVDAEVTVIHYREGNRYEVVSISGDDGFETPGDLYLSHWVYDVSEDLLLPFTTINGALAYGSIASGDYVFIKPGIFDESITLIDGVIVTELIPGTVFLHSTSANTCVTTAAGGYINVKEIKVTRAAGNAAQAVLSSHAASVCEVRAELIEATITGSVGAPAETAYGVYQTGAGTLYVYADWVKAFDAYDTIAAYASSGTQWVFSNLWAESIASSSYVAGAACGIATQYIYGHAFSRDCGGTSQAIAIFSAGSYQEIWGDCDAQNTIAAAVAIGAESGAAADTQIVHGNCYAKSTLSAYGAECNVTNVQEIYGSCAAETTGNTGAEQTYGAVAALGNVGTQRVHGDALATGVNGNRYGVYCVAGSQFIIGGRIQADTTDVVRTGGTLQVSMCDFDSYSGTITNYYPFVDDGWIGIAGGAGARFLFDATAAPDEINMQNANLVVDDDAWIGLGSAAGRFSFDSTAAPDQISILDANLVVEDDAWIGLGAAAGRIEFDDQATDEVLIKDAYLGVNVDPPLSRIHGVGVAERGVHGASTANYGVYGTSTNNAGVYGSSTNNIGVFGFGPAVGVDGNTTSGIALRGIASAGGIGAYYTVSDAVTAATTYVKDAGHNTSGVAAALFGAGERHFLEDDAGNTQYASNVVTLWADASSGAESPLRRWTTYPAGGSGPGYMGFWTWNDLDNTARTIIPNGTGDVVNILTIQYAVGESGGGTSGGVATVTPGNTVDIYDDGTDIFTVTCNADGSVEIARSAGASTADVALTMTWV